MKNLLSLAPVALSLALALASTAEATEGGGSAYPLGIENYVCCALPPPGLYGMLFVQHYRADTLKDNNGDTVPLPVFSVEATAVAPRVVWITGEQIAGASLGFHAILPLVDLNVSVPPGSQSKRGIGDLTFGPVLGWHLSPQLHTVLALDLIAPTGRYEQNDIANIGRNYWAAQLVGGVSRIDPSGLNADAKLMYTVNRKNQATDYRSGDEFIVDYAIGWGLGNGWVVGVGGYLYRQTTDDEQRGATLSGNKGRALAVGPSVRYDSGKGWFIDIKYQSETGVRNRAEGDAVFVKAVVPF